MEMLNTDITKLLDKLYNLRGEDSVVLTKMEQDKQSAEETKERTMKEKTNLQAKIEKLTEDERVLAEEGQHLVTTLSQIKTNDFKTVLEKLNIAFNPDELSKEVNEQLPNTIEKIKEEKQVSKNELEVVESEMNSAIATMEELVIRKDEAVSNQNRLNEYFDLALSGNLNITREAIASLLEKFDFSEEEQREAAKLLMFPEDGLYAYEKGRKNIIEPAKSISEVFAEAKKEIVKEPVEEENLLNPKEELINLLTDLGFDYLDFTSNDLSQILTNYQSDILRKNVEMAKELNINIDMFVDNIELLYDNEFQNKIETLLEIGKESNDIYLYPSILVKYNNEELNGKIEEFKNSGLDPRQVPLMAY